MAKDTEPIPIKPSLSDTQARDHFIAVALREIIAWQLAGGTEGKLKLNHDQAGVLAVRYANSTMVARSSETVPLKTVVAKGTTIPANKVSDVPFNVDEELEKATAPKSIAEIIGDAEPCAEVK